METRIYFLEQVPAKERGHIAHKFNRKVNVNKEVDCQLRHHWAHETNCEDGSDH